MLYNDKQYVVLPTDKLTEVNIELIEELSYDDVRKSLDGSLSIIEYKGQTILNGQYLTHQEAIELMNTTEWKWPIPNEGGEYDF